MLGTLQDHISHLHHEIDDRSLLVRFGITVGALLALPLLGTAVRTLGNALGLGVFTLPLLVIAHVPAVIVLLGLWSIGCDVCRSG